MGKLKVHELAKELNLPSKDLVERLNNMGYSIKSHLSTLEDSEVAEIRKKFDNKNKEDGKKNQVKKDKKPIAPVIIRREVTRVETTESNNEKSSRNDRSDLGVVQRRTDASMNIKYRTEPRKAGNLVSNNKKEILKPNNMSEQNKEIKSEDESLNKLNGEVLKNEQTINKVESETESKKEEVKIDVKKEKTKNEDKESIKKINNVSQEVNEKSVISEKSVEKIQNNLSQTNNNLSNNVQPKVNANKSQVNKDEIQISKQNNEKQQNNKDIKNGNKSQFNKDGQYSRDNRNSDRNLFNKESKFGKDGQYNRDNKNNDKQQFNRDGKSGKDARNRQFNREGQYSKDNRNGDRQQYNKDGQYNRNNRQQKQPENKIEKGIKEIMSTTVAADIPSKEVARENVRTE